jgi:hypothetical protein
MNQADAWRMIRRRPVAAGIMAPIGNAVPPKLAGYFADFLVDVGRRPRGQSCRFCCILGAAGPIR